MVSKTEVKVQIQEVTKEKKQKWAEFQELKGKLKQLRADYKTAE